MTVFHCLAMLHLTMLLLQEQNNKFHRLIKPKLVSVCAVPSVKSDANTFAL